jgi:hypothetical protein
LDHRNILPDPCPPRSNAEYRLEADALGEHHAPVLCAARLSAAAGVQEGVGNGFVGYL